MSSLLIIQVTIFVSLNNTKVAIRIRPNKNNVSKFSFVGLREVPLYCNSHVLLFTPQNLISRFSSKYKP